MNLPSLPRFSRAEVIFSLKSFAAAMLAMYFASRAGLPRPFWSLMTAYVVANPLAGAVRSKAIYRFLGTLVGSSATLVMVPALSNAPELLTLALALWVGFCLYVSLLDRTPRSYVFMLAGYTAALIGFPSVETPQTLFDIATVRVEEIWIGILCATLVHSVILPSGLAPSVLGLLDRTLRDARQWMADLLAPHRRLIEPDSRAIADDRRRLAGDITQLRLLSTHVPFDATHLRWTTGAIRDMQDRVVALTPVLSAVEQLLQALEEAEGALPSEVTALLARVGAWLERPRETDAAGDAIELKALRDDIQRLTSPASEIAVAWNGALRIALAARLDELVDGWHACDQLRRDIDLGLTGAAIPSRGTSALDSRALHRDHGMALLSALAAVISICLCSLIWILTGWPSGSAATMTAAVFCSFFATMDDPVPAIHTFLKWTLWSVPLSALYVLVLLPLVQDFGMLVLICAPTFIVLGLYLGRPSHFMAAMAMLLTGVAGTMALHDTGSADIVTFINGTLAQVVGIVVAARVTRLVRSVGADWSARRIQRATWRELGAMAASPRAPDRGQAEVSRMLDRIGLLAPRLSEAGGAIEGVPANDALRDLRVGADIASLQRARAALPLPAISELLADIARFFASRGIGRKAGASPGLLPKIDLALERALRSPTPVDEWRSAVTALVGLRRNLFPKAPPALSLPEGAAP